MPTAPVLLNWQESPDRVFDRQRCHSERGMIAERREATARYLEPTDDALGHQWVDAPIINVDETRWTIMGSTTPAKGTVWNVRSLTFPSTGSCPAAGPGRLSWDGRG